MKKVMNDHLITFLDNEEDYNIPKKQAPWNNQVNRSDVAKSDKADYFINNEEEFIINNINDFTCILREYNINNTKIKKFVNFCIKKRLFDDTFYDYSNDFSIIATRLPNTFYKISNGKKIITKKTFKTFFKKNLKYKGDISYVYKLINKENKNDIVWDEFKDFFLQFVKNITL